MAAVHFAAAGDCSLEAEGHFEDRSPAEAGAARAVPSAAHLRRRGITIREAFFGYLFEAGGLVCLLTCRSSTAHVLARDR